MPYNIYFQGYKKFKRLWIKTADWIFVFLFNEATEITSFDIFYLQSS